MKSCLFSMLLLVSFKVSAIVIGSTEFYSPAQFCKAIQEDQNHPMYKKEAIFERALKATVFVPKRGTAVIVSPDGIVLTAGHVISHLHIGATKSCPKLKFVLNHRMDFQDNRMKEVTLNCQEVLAYDYNKDFAKIKVEIPAGMSELPYVNIAPRDKIEDTYSFIAGHPGAHAYERSLTKISQGKIVFDGTHIEELPHFLHLIDTEGGNSGSPVFNHEGEVVGIHFRGIPSYADGVTGTLDGVTQVFKKFNVASRYGLYDDL